MSDTPSAKTATCQNCNGSGNVHSESGASHCPNCGGDGYCDEQGTNTASDVDDAPMTPRESMYRQAGVEWQQRAMELDEEVKRLELSGAGMKVRAAELAKRDAEIKRLREALEYYAEATYYDGGNYTVDGARAQRALKINSQGDGK